MKIFIAGICGTFMAGVAQIGQALGHEVSGCDQNIYPPMSEVLTDAGIKVKQGYLPSHIDADIDCIIIGNALSRGNAIVEHVLDNKLPYDSGPSWLSRYVLSNYKVIAVAGTHGKTSTASMITWILEQQGLSPAFLIGGRPGNFSISSRITDSKYFVIEADEYDTAFFDKRSKFVHYRPDIAVLNNLEFDHADIFDDLDQIKRQFHHLVRIIPSNGHIVHNQDDDALTDVLSLGSWSSLTSFKMEDRAVDKSGWSVDLRTLDASVFDVLKGNQTVGRVTWSCIGAHNMSNALAAIATCELIGIAPSDACDSLTQFIPSARRLERLFDHKGITLFEDFAHHPTAIARTIEALRMAYPDNKLIAIIEPRSNTMRRGSHGNMLGEALNAADQTLFYTPDSLTWNPFELSSKSEIGVFDDANILLDRLMNNVGQNTVIVAMSNGSFDDIPKRIKRLLIDSLM